MAKSKGGKSPSRNDQKSDVHNKTSREYKAAQDNRSVQKGTPKPGKK